jgi:hypothetical protein
VVSARLRPPRSDLALVVALAVLGCVACAVLPAGLAAARVPLALPLVLALPGYALASALFAPEDLGGGERIVLSLALSISAAILTGLAIDAVGLKLNAEPWVDILGVITLAACVVAARRGHVHELKLPRIRLRVLEALALGATAVLLAAAAALGFTPLAPPAKTHGTAGLGLLEAPHGRAAVCLSVINEQFHPAGYRVVVAVAGRGSVTFNTPRLVPGGSWTHELAVGSGFPAVQATLYRASSPASAYRNTYLNTWAPYLRAQHC